MTTIQGEDIKVRMTMTNDGVVIKPNDLAGYAVSVYFLASGKKTQLAKFESAVTGNYGITVHDNDAGKIDFIINREISPKIPDCDVFGELWIKETAASEFIQSKRKSGATGIFLFRMTAAANTNLT